MAFFSRSSCFRDTQATNSYGWAGNRTPGGHLDAETLGSLQSIACPFLRMGPGWVAWMNAFAIMIALVLFAATPIATAETIEPPGQGCRPACVQLEVGLLEPPGQGCRPACIGIVSDP